MWESKEDWITYGDSHNTEVSIMIMSVHGAEESRQIIQSFADILVPCLVLVLINERISFSKCKGFMKKCYPKCIANITANKKKKISSLLVESHKQLRSVWLAICMAIFNTN